VLPSPNASRNRLRVTAELSMTKQQKCSVAETLEQEIAESSVAKILDGARSFGLNGPNRSARDSAFEHHEKLETKKTSASSKNLPDMPWCPTDCPTAQEKEDSALTVARVLSLKIQNFMNFLKQLRVSLNQRVGGSSPPRFTTYFQRVSRI